MGMDQIVYTVADHGPWLVVALLTLNLGQRRHLEHGERKRLATLYLSLLALGIFSAAQLILLYDWPSALLLLAVAGVVVVAMTNHAYVFPFRLRCRTCEVRLGIKRIIFYDSNRCASCERADGEPADTPPATPTPPTPPGGR